MSGLDALIIMWRCGRGYVRLRLSYGKCSRSEMKVVAA